MKTLLDAYKQNPDIIFSADLKDHSPEPETSREFKNILSDKIEKVFENEENSVEEEYYKSGYCCNSKEAEKAGLSIHDNKITIRSVEFIGNDNKRICTEFPSNTINTEDSD